MKIRWLWFRSQTDLKLLNMQTEPESPLGTRTDQQPQVTHLSSRMMQINKNPSFDSPFAGVLVKQTEKTTPTSGGEPTPSPSPTPTPSPTQDSVPSEDLQKSEGDVSQPGDDGRTRSSQEKVVSVEKEGCATVLMIPERRVAQVVLADGSVVTGTSRGTFEASG